MGFKIKKVVEQKPTFDIHLNVNILYESDNGEKEGEDTLEVIHHLRMAETPEREKHQQLLIRVKGQSVKSQGSSEANFWLWKQCMTHLEGYDDLPDTREQIIKLFDETPILRIHAEKAAELMLSKLSADEADTGKK